MLEATVAGSSFNPKVKNVWPSWVKKPIPNIQIISFKFGVIQLIITIGNKVIKDISGKYFMIM